MPSYFITGVSRSKGIGFEFLRQLSDDPQNVVIGLVRDKASTEKNVIKELKGRQNIHILQGDLVDYNSLKKAFDDTSAITGGSLDYLIANAAFISKDSGQTSISDHPHGPAGLEKDLSDSFNANVIGNVHLINVFLPLIFKGSAKKVISISTGMADDDLISKYDVDIGAPYAISKAALNTAIAKFSAAHRKDGVLFISISPGFVETGHFDELTPEQQQRMGELGAKFAQYAPNFKGPISPEESVKAVLSVVENASVEKGDGGSFVSHLGTKQWL